MTNWRNPMKKMVTAVMVAAAVLGSVYALGDKKTKQTVITVLDYQDATAPNSFEDNKLIWEAFEAAHPDIKIEREVLFNEPFHQKTAAYAASGKASTTVARVVSTSTTSIPCAITRLSGRWSRRTILARASSGHALPGQAPSATPCIGAAMLPLII